jgi:methyl-galactoside transport system substrate-binding protein
MDKRKIKNAMALIGLMGFLLYGACGSEKKEIPKQIYIGVACYDQRDTFLGELLENFKRECRTLEKRGPLWMLQIRKERRTIRCRK